MTYHNRFASQAAGLLPLSQFRVTLAGEEVMFRTVDGLEATAAPADHCRGNADMYSTIKVPRGMALGTVTLKQGAFPSGGAFWDWLSGVTMNRMKYQDVMIALLDAGRHVTRAWTIKTAFPTKITGTRLKADGSDVAVEAVELAHKGITDDTA